VRHHGDVARIEVPAADLERLITEPDRSLASSALRALGFAYVTVDLEGFRSGSLNEVLPRASAAAPGMDG
jgi:uncharacterized protein